MPLNKRLDCLSQKIDSATTVLSILSHKAISLALFYPGLQRQHWAMLSSSEESMALRLRFAIRAVQLKKRVAQTNTRVMSGIFRRYTRAA